MDGGTSSVTCASAIDTAFPFEKRDVGPLLRIHAAVFQRLAVVLHLVLAMAADHAHESLCQDAVQRGNKIVGFHADVQEASDHVDDVIRVDGGKYQVAGERRVDGDLGRLGVADFADHDLVGIVTQD